MFVTLPRHTVTVFSAVWKLSGREAVVCVVVVFPEIVFVR